jgi:hypothetical protein
MLDGELAPEVETESITPGSAQLAEPIRSERGRWRRNQLLTLQRVYKDLL